MSQCKRLLALLVVGGLTWWLASAWYINVSECFYFSVPPAALAFYLTGRARKDPATSQPFSKTEMRSGLALFAAVLLLGVCTMSWVYGPRVLYSWKYWLEFVTALYMLAALCIVVIGFLRLLMNTSALLGRRCPDSPFVGNVLAPAMALSLFVLVAVPFGVAFSYVYRVKLPNVANPQADLGREYENVEIVCGDGTRLAGWWVPARTHSSRTIVFCHGLAANRTQTLKYHAIADWLDANLLLFDMRGHGDSAGRASSMGYRERDDVLSAIAYLRQQRPSQSRQVIGMGVSLGAAVLADIAAELEPPLDGLILDSGFTATADMDHSLPAFLRGWLLTIGLPIADWNAGCPITEFRPVASIGRARAPVVLFHSLHDWITPAEHSMRLYERAAEPKQLVILDASGHVCAYFERHQEYETAVRKFAEGLAKQK
ncbi:MAG TPA: alpha/beta fold hydrolase [Gemmataceae bacterium]|nr:alpha/beta fold hydrolase [Gemmataceae bacterium]